jgi:hypothetical protein
LKHSTVFKVLHFRRKMMQRLAATEMK